MVTVSSLPEYRKMLWHQRSNLNAEVLNNSWQINMQYKCLWFASCMHSCWILARNDLPYNCRPRLVSSTRAKSRRLNLKSTNLSSVNSTNCSAAAAYLSMSGWNWVKSFNVNMITLCGTGWKTGSGFRSNCCMYCVLPLPDGAQNTVVRGALSGLKSKLILRMTRQRNCPL